jgi:PAS domain S-box-containing protein
MALKAGADDYLVKSSLDAEKLERAISYAVERKRSNRLFVRMGRMMDASVNEIFVFEAKGLGIVQSNARVQENLGYSEEEMHGMLAQDLLAEASQEEFIRGIDALRARTSDEVVFEAEQQRKDGSLYPVEILLQLFEAEHPPIFLATALDITTRREHENELQRAQKMQAVGQLAGGLAHDFNNLLTVILGNLEMLKLAGDRKASWTPEDLVDEAHGAALRGVDLTQRLLLFARRQPLEPSAVKPDEILEAIEPLLRRTLGPTIKLKISAHTELPSILVDCAQLENALLNLAMNARDAMPEGGELHISAEAVDASRQLRCNGESFAAGRCVRLNVRDSGEGIGPELLERVCEPFFTTKEAGSGTGLGLSMVYGFIEQSGGGLDISSIQNHGTTVSIILPTCVDAQPSPQPSDEVAPPGGNEMLLVVEDDKDVRLTAMRILSGLGYTVAEATSGDRAMRMLEDGLECDLLFTDLYMPGSTSGIALAEQIRARRPNLPIVLTSGYRYKFADETPDGTVFLSKPYSAIELAECVRRAIDYPADASGAPHSANASTSSLEPETQEP